MMIWTSSQIIDLIPSRNLWNNGSINQIISFTAGTYSTVCCSCSSNDILFLVFLLFISMFES